MRRVTNFILSFTLLFVPSVCVQSIQGSLSPSEPTSWRDARTGYSVTRLTYEPGSKVLYFNETAFTPDGKQMVYTCQAGVMLLDMQSRETTLLIKAPVGVLLVSHKTPSVFFTKLGDPHLYRLDLNTLGVTAIGELPKRGQIDTINSDETLAAGTYVEGEAPDFNQLTLPPGIRPSKAALMVQRVEAKLPMAIFTMDLSDGRVNVILRGTDWYSHLQFSPKDPGLLMYCHEGIWQDVDRVWVIRADGSGNTLVHQRELRMEVAGHEFWGNDGKTIWYDLQRPKGEKFFLASYNVDNGRRQWFEMNPNQWSIHFNASPDDSLFCGDGGDPFQVANAPDGEWIELFHAKIDGRTVAYAGQQVALGRLESEQLVDMSKHDYRLEPNVRFSPDGRWVIFNSTTLGASAILGVQIDPEPMPVRSLKE